MSFSQFVLRKCNALASGFHFERYWKARERAVSSTGIRSALALYRVRRMESRSGANLSARIGSGAHFASPPNLIHGINGIFIAPQAVIGKNCTIYHQVTIGIRDRMDTAPIIGDNVFIGAGAKIIGKVRVGDNAKIGANTVVIKDVPENATVVSAPSRYILHEPGEA